LCQGQGLLEEGRVGFAHTPVIGDADAFHTQVHGLEGGTGPGGLVTGNDQGESLGTHRRKGGSYVCVQVGLPEVFALAVGVLVTPTRTLGGQVEPGNERAYTVGDGSPRGQDTTDGSEESHVGDRSEEHTSELQSRFDLVC